MTEQISKAGDVILDNVVIVSSNGTAMDITPQVLGLEVFENIHESFLSGSVMISDCQAIRSFFPMTGSEFIRFSFSTPSLPKDDAYAGEFFIYKSTDAVRSSGRGLMYKLYFVSKESVIDQNKRLSRVFKGNPSTMMDTLLGDVGLQTMKEYYIEEPKNSFAFCANFWKPTKCIQYIANHSVSPSDSPSYLFFENKRGFIFTSLEDIIKKEVPIIQHFTVNNYTRKMDGKQSAPREIERDYQTILEITYKTGFDYFQRLRQGYYGGETISFDLTTQRYFHRVFNRPFDSDSHLNRYSPTVSNAPITTRGNLQFEPRMSNNFENFADNSKFLTERDREAIMTRLITDQLIITVHGRTDYSVGQKVYVSIPKNAQITENDNSLDMLSSGTYLITSLCHSVTHKSHKTILELSKDSMLVDVNESAIEK